MIRLFLMMLWVWGLGVIPLLLVTLADLAFTWRWRDVGQRFLISLVWPFAIFSARGRSRLTATFIKTQETAK
jgi:hypothetical protein